MDTPLGCKICDQNVHVAEGARNVRLDPCNEQDETGAATLQEVGMVGTFLEYLWKASWEKS